MPTSPIELKSKLKGVIHLLMTPFKDNEALDVEALKVSTRWTVDHLKGEDAVILITGSTGEFYNMSDEECKTVAEVVCAEVNGELPVVVGTARPGTQYTIEMSRHAQSVGADGVMIVMPYYDELLSKVVFELKIKRQSGFQESPRFHQRIVHLQSPLPGNQSHVTFSNSFLHIVPA